MTTRDGIEMTSESGELFEGTVVARVAGEVSVAAAVRAAVRVLLPNRKQMEFRASDLESLLPQGHRARMVWGYVERQDMAGLYARIQAVEGGVGRAAIAPEILFALW
jgi:hypothetical protein